MAKTIDSTISVKSQAACPFEIALATHCAPVLFGKKPAALFPERCLPDTCPWQLLREQGFLMVRLCRQNQNTLILICHPSLLEASLSDESTCKTLKEMGYPVQKSWRALLGFLCKRFRESPSFPHEVGFFLGYPPKDVLGFMRCAGNSKLCGAWKVYGDEAEAARCFDEYARCRELLLDFIQNGGSILRTRLTAKAC